VRMKCVFLINIITLNEMSKYYLIKDISNSRRNT